MNIRSKFMVEFIKVQSGRRRFYYRITDDDGIETGTIIEHRDGGYGVWIAGRDTVRCCTGLADAKKKARELIAQLEDEAEGMLFEAAICRDLSLTSGLSVIY